MGKEDESPLVRIADSLERMEVLLMKMANPPIMVRGIVGEKDTTIEFPSGLKTIS